MFPISENTILPTAADIPVVFYDGEREIDLGKVQVLSTMTFKMFQTLVSSKIGISPHQITIYFERHNHHRRRHPVTNKFDFRALVADPAVDGCFFWVVLKRGRRNRRRRNNSSGVGNLKNDQLGGDGFVLLRRDVNDWVYLENVEMMAELERQRQNYLMSLNLNSNVYNELSGHYYDINEKSVSSDDFDYYDGASCSTGGDRALCDVCYTFGQAAPFHWCRNDVVTLGFRSSPAGPIAPPSKTNLYALGMND